MLVSDFDFDLPQELIAQEPPPERGGSRLLVLHRSSGAIEHRVFSDLPEYLRAGDLLVLNNTRVFPARLLGRRVPSGGSVECLLLGRAEPPGEAGGEGVARVTPATGPPRAHVGARGDEPAAGPVRSQSPPSTAEFWTALVHPGQKLKSGAYVVFERDGVRLHGEILGRPPSGSGYVESRGRRIVALWTDAGTVANAVEALGHIPLPPYIARADTPADRDRYQTVFARHRGSIAAPTAGLHFTESTLAAVGARGVEIAEVTLHVGYGTFKPVRVDEVESHEVDPEWYEVTPGTAAALDRARREGRRIIAVGTTTTRVLESLQVEPDGRVVPATGETKTFIYPGHRFQLVDGLVTNFHLPRSSLLMLVAALGGRDRVLHAYREAVAHGYRFYSYGDAMIIV